MVVVLNNRPDPNKDESFFVSDSSKYVVESKLVHTGDEAADIGTAVTSYHVYDLNGDNIVGYKVYYEFKDEEAAKRAIQYYQSLEDENVRSVDLDGKYIILTASESQYEGMTVDFVKKWAELYDNDVDVEDDVVVEDNDGEVDESQTVVEE